MKKFNTTKVYLLTTLSLITMFCCCCFGLGGLGVIPAAIAFYMAHNALKELERNPDAYVNGPAIKRSRTLALILLIITGLMALHTVYYFTTTESSERKENIIKGLRDADVSDDQIDQVEPYLF